MINQTRVQFAPKVSARTLPNDPTGAEIIFSGIGTFGGNVHGAVQLRSGIPFTVLASQADVNGDTHTNDRPFYAARTTGLGEPYYDVDVRLNKCYSSGGTAA